MKHYVVIAGNIGAGKSTLVGMMCDRLGWKAYFEPVAENPYLEDFYRDMSRWAFHSQVFFLTHRVRSHRALMDDPASVIQDRSLYEDAEIFARNLYLQGRMNERDWETYSGLYRTLTTVLPPPDLVVYLRASVATPSGGSRASSWLLCWWSLPTAWTSSCTPGTCGPSSARSRSA
jgi:deoxyadenosine/deoxycytidine kinase